MIEFKKYEGSDTELKELGTLAEVAGKDATIALYRKNWNSNKRVAVVVTKKDGTSAVVSCSQQVSDALRKGELTVAQLTGLVIVENNEGIAFISMPAGKGQEFKISELKAQPVKFSDKFLPEAVLAF